MRIQAFEPPRLICGRTALFSTTTLRDPRTSSLAATIEPCTAQARLTTPSSGHTTAGRVCALRQGRWRRCVPLMSNVRPRRTCTAKLKPNAMQASFSSGSLPLVPQPVACLASSLRAAAAKPRHGLRRARAACPRGLARAARPSAVSGPSLRLGLAAGCALYAWLAPCTLRQ